MVILPLYQILYAETSENRTAYAALMKDGRTRPVDISLDFPAYAPASQNICGIDRSGEKDLIEFADFRLTGSDPQPLFTLSDKRILYPAVSPDNQKVAFIAVDEAAQDVRLRVILREEFGWFPMPFVKLAAGISPVCFSNRDTVIYTDETGALNAALLSKKPKTARLEDKGVMPAFHEQKRMLAFVCGQSIIVRGAETAEIPTGGIVTALNFSSAGDALYFAEGRHIRRYVFQTQTAELLHTAAENVVMVTDI